MEVRCFFSENYQLICPHLLLIIVFSLLKLKARAPFTVHILKSYFFSLPEAKYSVRRKKSLISGIFLKHKTIVARALEFLMKQLFPVLRLLEMKWMNEKNEHWKKRKYWERSLTFKSENGKWIRMKMNEEKKHTA